MEHQNSKGWLNELEVGDEVVVYFHDNSREKPFFDIQTGIVENIEDDGFIVSEDVFDALDGICVLDRDSAIYKKIVRFDDLNKEGKQVYHYKKMKESQEYKEKLEAQLYEITMRNDDWRMLIGYFNTKKYLISAFKDRYDIDPRKLRDVSLFISGEVVEEQSEIHLDAVTSIKLKVGDWLLVYEVLRSAEFEVRQKALYTKRESIRNRYCEEQKALLGILKWIEKIFEIKINAVK